MDPVTVILASSSVYRAERLATLGFPFLQRTPEFSEDMRPGEPPRERAERLARGKADALGYDDSAHLVIGCDQVAMLGDTTLHKPGNAGRAREQLAAMAGQTVSFTCGLHIAWGARTFTGSETYSVTFRSLTAAEIDDYIAADEPYYSAGSIKAEALGLALIETASGRDINTLYGIPLMLFCDALIAIGIDVFTLRKSAISMNQNA